MKTTICAALLTAFSVSLPAAAENLSDLNQLLSTKQCSQCDLSGAGLVLSDLAGANLSGANLSGANLSQTNLTGADLSGANLSGASLYGANLSGANLTGANLSGTDLRDSYLYNTNLLGTNLETTYIQGAAGIPNEAATPEQFHLWGMTAAQQGEYQAAIAHLNRALSVDPNYAPAYLGRGFVAYRLGNGAAAIQDAQKAAELFEAQEDAEGLEASQNFLQGIEAVREAEAEAEANKKKSGGLGLHRVIGGVGSLLLRFLVPMLQ